MTLDQFIAEQVATLVDERVNARLAEFRREQTVSSDLPEVMTVHQVADALSCSRQHVNALGRLGLIKRKEDGNRYLYLREWVLDYLRSGETVPPMPAAVRKELNARHREARA